MFEQRDNGAISNRALRYILIYFNNKIIKFIEIKRSLRRQIHSNIIKVEYISKLVKTVGGMINCSDSERGRATSIYYLPEACRPSVV